MRRRLLAVSACMALAIAGSVLPASGDVVAHLVRDINLSGVSSTPHLLTEVGGTLFFVVSGASGFELWRSDGTASGTILVKGIGPENSSPAYLTAVGTTLFFTIDVDAGTEARCG